MIFFTQLSDRLLDSSGILERLKEIQSTLSRIPLEHRDTSYRKKIESIRTDLKSIFSESPFQPDYSLLQKTLTMVFSDKPLDEMITAIESLTETDWRPEAGVLAANYQRLNDENKYFQSERQHENLMTLFESLVVSCRKVCVLIEKNNTPSDTMAYDYAYKLMALFIDERQPLPSFQALSKDIEKLLTPSDQVLKEGSKPFHDHLLDLRLPDRAHDRKGWLTLLQQAGAKALPFFVQAIAIEEKLNGRAPKSLKEARDTAALLTYERAVEDPEWAQLCYYNKVPESTFNASLDYIGNPPVWPKKLTDKIPDITVEDDAYVWTKLSAHDKRGLILGKITDCCQSIGDHSGQCVKDALSLDKNGLYVLLKQKKSGAAPKKQDGSINDDAYQIIGQSYLWKSKSGNLCLDSIECLRDSVTIEQLQKILSSFAGAVLESDASIKRVTVGTGGKTPENLFSKTATIAEQISEGLFYGDARRQYVIAERPCRLTEAQQQVLKERYKSPFYDCVLYFSDYMTEVSDFVERLDALVGLDPNFPKDFSVTALYRLLRFTPEPTFDDLERVDFGHLPPPDIIFPTGRLMWQADRAEKIIQALPHICAEDRLAVAKEKDPEGDTVLHHVSRNPESLQIILALYPAEERLTAVQEKDRTGRSVLHGAASNPESLQIILSLLPASERLTAVKEKDPEGYTVLHDAASNPESLQTILSLLPESERLTAVKEKDPEGCTVLHDAASNPESLKIILSLLPTSERLTAVKEQDYFHSTVLRHAASNPESLKTILSLLPASERLTAVKEKDESGCTVLHDAASNPESLQIILSLYPESDRLTAVKEKNLYSSTVLRVASRNPESLQTILSLLPIEHLIRLAHDEDKIDFAILKEGLLSKATELDYSAEQVQSIRDANTREILQKTLNAISQASFKSSIPREPDDRVNSSVVPLKN